VLGTFHPTFLYELLWNLAAAGLVIWADRRFRLGHGRAFALYVAAYCAGRLWIELMRTDPAETFFGVRVNVFTAIIVGLLAIAYFVWQRGRPREVITRGTDQPAEQTAGTRAGTPVADDAGERADESTTREDDHRNGSGT
jgi:prolipoprotein diacylglyceryltransferase